MSFWKKCGFTLFLVPLIFALLIFLINIGKTNMSGLTVLFLVILSIILFIPSMILIIIGHISDKKKKKRKAEKDANDSDFKFDSYIGS